MKQKAKFQNPKNPEIENFQIINIHTQARKKFTITKFQDYVENQKF